MTAIEKKLDIEHFVFNNHSTFLLSISFMSETKTIETSNIVDVDRENLEATAAKTTELNEGEADSSPVFQSNFLQQWVQQLPKGDLGLITSLACLSNDKLLRLLYDQALAAAEAETNQEALLYKIYGEIQKIQAVIRKVVKDAQNDDRLRWSLPVKELTYGNTPWMSTDEKPVGKDDKTRVMAAYHKLREYLDEQLKKICRDIADIQSTKEQAESFNDLGEQKKS